MYIRVTVQLQQKNAKQDGGECYKEIHKCSLMCGHPKGNHCLQFARQC